MSVSAAYESQRSNSAENSTSLDKNQTREDLSRYSRQIVIREIGVAGQEKLKESKILVVGMGGLGTAASTYLAMMGVGHIGIIDFDVIELSNLNRQFLYSLGDIGKKKVEIAKEKLRIINPEIDIQGYEEKLSPSNALDMINPYDIIVDGTDNMITRYLMSDASVILDKQNVHASIFGFEGEITIFSRSGPCYRCLYPKPVQTTVNPLLPHRGVAGFLPGMVGVMEAGEAVDLILQNGTSLAGRLILVNGSDMKFTEIEVDRNPSCSACGEPAKLGQLDEEFYARFV